MSLLNGLKDSVAFLTIIPVEIKDEGLNEVANYMWIFPLVGLILGGVAGIIGHISLSLFPLSISSALALFLLLFLSGFHHLDGLLDFGDALMFRGTKEERRKVMCDVNTGVGGFGLGFFVLLITFLSINESLNYGWNFFQVLISAEVLAKLSMVTASYLGKPFHQGMGSAFTDAMNMNHSKAFLSLSLSAIVVYFFLQFNTFILIIITILSTLVLVQLSNRLLGGISGDTLGATNEITRAIIILTMVVI